MLYRNMYKGHRPRVHRVFGQYDGNRAGSLLLVPDLGLAPWHLNIQKWRSYGRLGSGSGSKGPAER